MSQFRRSRLLRSVVSMVIGSQLVSAEPILAQDVARATVAASQSAVADAKRVFAQARTTVTRATRRIAADVQRKIAKARVRVNRTVPKVTAPSLEVAFGAHVTTEALSRVRVFAEPMLPTAPPTDDQNRQLAALLQGIAGTDVPHRLLRIEQFLADHPATPWRASLLANAAGFFAREGYFSRAAAYWEHAWELTRDSIEPNAKAIADYTLGESMTQMATFGQVPRMQQRLTEIASRDVRGAAGAKVDAARTALFLLTEHHDLAIYSGPMALKMYLAAAQTATVEQSLKTIEEYHAPMEGTSLTTLRQLATSAGMALAMVHAAPIGEIPVPSVVHLRSQHFSAIVGKEGDRYLVRDPSLGGMMRLSEAALRDESTGYFLVASRQAKEASWRVVSDSEASAVVGHCFAGTPSNYDPPCPKCGDPPPGPGGMPSHGFHPVSASLVIEDVPVGYQPPVGPAVQLHLSYNHRDGRQPQTMTFGNVGPIWTFNALSWVNDNFYYIMPPYIDATVVLRGQGKEAYLTVPGTHPLSRARLEKVSHDPPRYERHLPDGTIEVFTQPDRPASELHRKTFLTEVIDPQGHSLTYTYDSSLRMVAITDAIGQVTTLEYLNSANPLLITKVTDPFGRFATLTYDASGRLQSVTDAHNMTSSFAYGASDFISAMTTPYGTTTFRHEAPSAAKRIEATDPMGGTERLEFHFQNNALAETEASNLVPTGFSASNASLHMYNSLFWDKRTMAQYPGDITKAVITGWMFGYDSGEHHPTSRNVPHSVKKPLENRVWYRYEGQGSGRSVGNGREPALIGRVLDDGSSQVTQMTYNSKGMVTSRIDPAGRQTNYTYATNGQDLLTVEQVRSGGTDVIQTYADYNAQHLPETITDAAGQDTTMTYNSAGQVLTATNAKNETTTYAYDTNGYFETVTGPVSGATTTYTYDAYGRIESVEDADGYAVITDYDHLNRVTQRTYPDDTTEINTYSRLDLIQQTDRLGRITRHVYDRFGRRIATQDPAGRTISQVWCDCGTLDALVDANGNRTKWERDIQNRVTREIRADNTTDTHYTYDLAGRLKTITDPKDQVTTHSYNLDDSLSGTAYTDEEIETPNVSYTYDTYYARVATIVDGTGTTSYTYKAAGTNGAGQVATVDGPLSNDTIAYTYDELGRIIQRTINGSANQVDWTFDALGRVTSEANLLGEFTFTYDGVTKRLATVTYPNDQTSTYSYLDEANDHRLQTIHHKYPNSSTLSKFDYTYDAAGNILTWRQQADSTTVMWKYGYDPADQLIAAVKHATDAPETVLKRYAYAYDRAGNRTVEQIDDAVTLSAYDNLNRLTSQAPGGPLVVAGTLNEPGTVTISGVPVTVDASNSFRGTVPTTTGTNTFTIVAKDATGNTTTQTYEVDIAGTGRTFTYDANGNLLSDGSRSLGWDATDRNVTVEVGTSVLEISYNAANQRSREILSQDTTVTNDEAVIWCGATPCEHRSANGSAVRRNFEGGQYTNAGMLFIKDHLGSVSVVADADSQILTRYAYDPWGSRELVSGSDSTAVGFTGHLKSPIGDLWLSQFRVLVPQVGKWASQDPSGFQDGPNLYAYVQNRPIASVDPFGLQGTQGQRWTFGEIESWAITSVSDFTAPAGLADAVSSIQAVCTANGGNCRSNSPGSNAPPGSRASWNNITNATGGTDRTGGGTYMCVGSQDCWIVRRCYTCRGGKPVLVPRTRNLQPTGTVNVGGRMLYFYSDPLQGWCNAAERRTGCGC